MVMTRGISGRTSTRTVNTANPCELQGTHSLCKHLALGGASGAGLGQAKLFAKNGMKVAIGDVRQDALDNAVKEIVAYAGCAETDVLAIKVDLTNRAEYTAAADKVEETFGGPPHLFIQTAGVNSFGPVEASTFDDFDWVVGVCFNHVVNGLLIFVPRMIKAYATKEEFHVATTSSMGAFMAGSGTGPYSAAKAAAKPDKGVRQPFSVVKKLELFLSVR